jgi:hypothetical protein
MPEVRSIEANVSATDVPLVTTAETVIVSSPLVTMEEQTQQFLIIGWAQVTTGANATSITAKLRRGTTTSGTLVNEANAVADGIAAAKTSDVLVMALESQANLAAAQYSLTITQAGASGNGNVLQAGIVVIAL